MTSRERVMTALSHRPPDQVPLDLSGHRSSGISAIAYRRLREFLDLPARPIRVYDPVQQLAVVDADVLDRFGVDTIELGRAFALEDRWWSDWELPDGTACQLPVWVRPERVEGEWILRSPQGRVMARMPDGVLYFEQAYYPFAEQEDIEHLESYFPEGMWTGVASPPGPITAGDDGLRLLGEGARRLRRETDRAILGLFGGNLLEMGQFFYRNDNFLLLLAADPAQAHRFLDRVLEVHLRNLDRFLTAVGEHIDVILFGDDLGMQSGPQVSPRMYREFFQPREREMWRRVKALAPSVRIMLHCCGGVRELLPDLIDAGLEAINPVQITCRGMDPAGLKRDFGDRLTFWGGGCDTRDALSHGTPAQVREHVLRLLDLWRPGGGYVFQQVHNVMADVPPANLVAMLEAVRSAG